MTHPLLTRTWEVDEVRVELRDALTLVDELSPPDDLRVSAFTFAVQLLTQRAQRNVAGVVLPQS